jgi:4-alpha-glucanotransferase
VLLLPQVSEYAASKRVVLKGDLPIGVDKRSVDTWLEVSGLRNAMWLCDWAQLLE